MGFSNLSIQRKGHLDFNASSNKMTKPRGKLANIYSAEKVTEHSSVLLLRFSVEQMFIVLFSSDIVVICCGLRQDK